MQACTWCMQRQTVVQSPGLGGDEKVAEHTYRNDEGQKNHRCYWQAHQRPNTEKKKEGITGRFKERGRERVNSKFQHHGQFCHIFVTGNYSDYLLSFSGSKYWIHRKTGGLFFKPAISIISKQFFHYHFLFQFNSMTSKAVAITKIDSHCDILLTSLWPWGCYSFFTIKQKEIYLWIGWNFQKTSVSFLCLSKIDVSVFFKCV